MVNAQEWLDKYYPKNGTCQLEEKTILKVNNFDKARGEITKLDIKYKNLTGELKISGFSNLTILHCYNNKLTNLEVNECVNLTELNCSDNKLTDLDFLQKLNPTKLTSLDIKNNNFSTSDCSVFSHLVNLEWLWICSDNLEQINQGIYNRFTGSLKPLQNLTKLIHLDIQNTDLNSGLEYLPNSLEFFFCSTEERPTALSQQLINQLIVYGQPKKDIFGDDNYAHLLPIWKQQAPKWKQVGFSDQEIKQWLNAGAKVDDHRFVAWLRDVKKETPEWINNYQEDYQILSNRFKKYGLCQECNQPNTGEQWCRDCNNSRLQKVFIKWTSHNPKVDEFIQKYQLQATDANKFIEWIPYKQFTQIEYLTEGGFGKIYKANWKVGNIHYWDQSNKQWRRGKDNNADHRTVVLKILTNSQNNTDFLQETANHKIIDDWFNNIVPCYGISQDPNTKNYLMVMQYMPEGNLRDYLSKNNRELEKISRELKEKLILEKEFSQEIKDLRKQPESKKNKQQELNKLHSEIVDLQNKLSLENKFKQLFHLSQGLKDLHQKNLVHHDFHSGNILKGIKKTSCLITDLGLCKPVGENNQEKVFGVLPYVAPEVLQSQPYTQASDIYSFGIIAYELFSGLPPYYDRVHDVNLGVEICRGLRPRFQIKIPSLLKNLINRCWDTDPLKRPNAHELERSLRSWKQENAEFKNQLQKAEEHNKTLSDEVKFPNYKIHHGAVYYSKLLPTREITQLMQNFNFQNKILELNEHLTKAKELAKEITMEQKYNDFKKILKLVLEKSEELETIITTNQIVISEEMKKVLTKIKELKHKSQEKDGAYQKIKDKKFQKEQELIELKKFIINSNHLEEDELENILEVQANFLRNNNPTSLNSLNRNKKQLARMISEAEINQLCQVQTEITNLELELNKNIDQSTRQLTQIINNIKVGDISIEHSQFAGSVVIGVGEIIDSELNTINQTKSIEIEEFQTQIEISLK